MSPILSNKSAIVIGGGLAGCEAAYQLAKRGVRVTLYEMRYTGRDKLPPKTTPAHQSGLLAELVCSNSLKSTELSNAHGLLKAELELLNSLIVKTAKLSAVPAGKALAVDRIRFAQLVTERIAQHEAVTIRPEEAKEIPETPAVIASGPLTSETLADRIARFAGKDNLFFYDAIAPIVSADSLDYGKMFKGSRYSDDGQYWNCPLTKDRYRSFVSELAAAQRHRPHDFEAGHFYEGCLPVEVMAERSRDSLRFGMMKPIGLFNPHEGRRPYAALQLRQENASGTMFNLVGFQTQLARNEQKRVFSMIPGLERAEYLRFGSMHRNTYLNAPGLLLPTMQSTSRPDLFFAGQLTGVEGYVESAASGLIAGINLARALAGKETKSPPETTMTGQLCRYVAVSGSKSYQPMNANLGLLPPLDTPIREKPQRNQALSKRSLGDLAAWIEDSEI
ncbi:MAG: methylenetetrahydrofolate--tRNA-(uracil(54)-C(5))-methyltransferase (FADH(2)-oxidizing) TrmFO [Candidatus Edwardsbacteria bacterium]|nr:methylenetetrahydrofolate--tRNA-(uracil(54)-C(5))-methyltransferase (FADH(2)-oxidizing) TrmFO [Candidatus Edwardsbacteria bacterium]